MPGIWAEKLVRVSMRIKTHRKPSRFDGFLARCGFLIHEGGGMPQR
jgi:hypothetical protein